MKFPFKNRENNNLDQISELELQGDNLRKSEKYEEAIEYYDKILKIEPDNTRVLNNKGVLLNTEALGRHEEAISCFDMILKITPDDLEALNNKGVSLIMLKKYEEAVEYYNKMLKIEPDNITALNNKGIALYEMNNNDDAFAIFDRILDLTEEQHANSLFYKSVLLTKQGYTNPPIILLERLLVIDYTYKEKIKNEEAFKPLAENLRFKKLFD